MGPRQKNGSLKYSILEIPDEFGPDQVLKIILDLGRVSGTCWALLDCTLYGACFLAT